MRALIAREFPTPTKGIENAFAELKIAAGKDKDAKAELGPTSELPRPWYPVRCPPTLRQELWRWLDRVVVWINHEYIWQADRIIPACWPAHPQIVHELAPVACLRLSAQDSFLADQLEAWHRDVLPDFLDRMAARFDGVPCHPGRHQPWPAASRYTDFTSRAAQTLRRQAFAADTGEKTDPDGSDPGPATASARPSAAT